MQAEQGGGLIRSSTLPPSGRAIRRLPLPKGLHPKLRSSGQGPVYPWRDSEERGVRVTCRRAHCPTQEPSEWQRQRPCQDGTSLAGRGRKGCGSWMIRFRGCHRHPLRLWAVKVSMGTASAAQRLRARLLGGSRQTQLDCAARQRTRQAPSKPRPAGSGEDTGVSQGFNESSGGVQVPR